MAYAVLAALPTEGPPPGDAGLALTAVLRDLLQLPASKGNGGAAGESAAVAVESVAAAHDGLHGETDLHAVQLLCALRAQLGACPELADCSDFGAFIVKKYAPAAERAGELVPPKNKRFAEFARVVALAPRALHAEFDPATLRRRARAATSGTTTAPTTGSEFRVYYSQKRGKPTPTTTPRRRRCTASSPRWRRPASTSATTCLPIPGLKSPGYRRPPPSGVKKLRVCHVQYH